MKAVIICGGIGSKMWPMSRSSMPKHFLPLIGNKSLFELNYEALRKKFGPEEIFLQTNEVQAKIAKSLKPEIPEENIFAEPEMRNQGPATGSAAPLSADPRDAGSAAAPGTRPPPASRDRPAIAGRRNRSGRWHRPHRTSRATAPG